MKRVLFVLFIVALAAIPVLAQPKSASKSTIQGVWRIVEVSTTGPDRNTNKNPQPSLFIFTGKHYSHTFVASKEARPVVDDASKSTVAELTAVFVDGFVGNAGTYELKNGKLTIRPIVAKNPGFMSGGGYITYGMKLSGNTLTLTEESASFTITDPDTLKLVRVEE